MPFPNTDINDGNEPNSDSEPVVAGILDSRGFVGDPFVHEKDRCTDGEAIADGGVPSVRQSSRRCSEESEYAMAG